MTDFRKVKVAGTGAYVPDRVLTNADLEKMVDTSDEWIVQRTGIRERRIRPKGEGTSHMAKRACLQALEKAELDPKDLQFLVVGTVTPDSPLPSVGCHLQRELGAPYIPAFDVTAACTGFIYGIAIATQFMQTGAIDNALVVGAESLTAITDYEDRATSILFGDGAGAIVLRATDDPGDGHILGWDIKADGSGDHLMYVPAGGSVLPPTHETVEKRGHFMKLKGREIFRFAVEKFIEQMGVCLTKAGITPDQVGLVVPHQVNIRIIDAAVRKLSIPMDKVMVNIDKYGNTSAASIPIALEEAVCQGRLEHGQYCILVAFGAGLTWGSVIFRY